MVPSVRSAAEAERGGELYMITELLVREQGLCRGSSLSASSTGLPHLGVDLENEHVQYETHVASL